MRPPDAAAPPPASPPITTPHTHVSPAGGVDMVYQGATCEIGLILEEGVERGERVAAPNNPSSRAAPCVGERRPARRDTRAKHAVHGSRVRAGRHGARSRRR